MDVLILTILFVCSALLLGYFRSPSYKGAVGERRVSSMFHRKLNQNYYIFNDVLLPTSNGTTQIDHLIVSIYGIFVIETKNMKGWIFGSANQKKWTQVIYKRKFSLYNPLHQNYKHVMAVKELINVNQNQIFSLVVFVGDCNLKTALPENVTYGKGGINYIKSKTEALLDDNQVQLIINKIRSYRLENTRENRKRHINNVFKS